MTERLRATVSAFSLLLLSGGAAGCASLSAPGQHHATRAFVVSSVSRLVVRGQIGNITITGSSGPSVSVRARLNYSSTPPSVSRQLSGQTLTVGYSCADQASCGVGFDLTVPRGIAVQVTDTTGSIAAALLAGSLTVKVGTGDISATDLSGAQVTLSSGTGNITGQFSATASAAATVQATAGTGDVQLSVPGPGPYRVTAVTGKGSTTVTVPRSVTAARTITARTGTGDVTISPS